MSDLRTALTAAVADRYTVLEELGGGGMSRVFLALNKRLGSKVVIKVLEPQIASELSVARFRDEIQNVVALQHTNIIAVHDAGEVDHLPYYVMAFVEGESLRARLKRTGPLPVGEAARLALEVADALDHAHSRRVMHRDIKPDNILLSGGHAVLADFGIAKAIHDATGPGRSKTDGVPGTLPYMAPELFTDPNANGFIADLYSLGVVLYEMLIGAAPFKELSGPALIATKGREPVPPVAPLRPDAGALGDLTMRLLEIDARKRPQSAAETKELLESIARSQRVPDRWRAVKVAATAAALTATVAFGAFKWSGRQSADSLVRAGALQEGARVLVADVSSTSGDSTLGRALTDALRIDLSGARGVHIVSRADIENALRRMALPISTPVSDSIAREIARRDGHHALVTVAVSPVGGGHSLVAHVRSPDGERELTSVRASAANDDGLLDALDDLSKQLRRVLGESVRSVAAAEPLPEVTTRSYEALQLYADAMDAERKGNVGVMRALLEESLRLDSTFAMASRRLAVLYSNELDFIRAVPLARRAARDAERLPPVERHYVLGSSAMVLNDVPATLRAFEEALRHDPNNAQVLNNLEATLVNAGQFERAIEVEAHLRTVDTTGVRPGAVNSLLTLGRPEEALALASQYVNGGYPRGPAMLLLARALIGAGQRDSGLIVLRQVIREFPAASLIGANARFVLADDLRMRGRAREAFALRGETIRTRWAVSPPSPQGQAFELAWQMAWAARLGASKDQLRHMFDTSTFVASLESVPLANQTPSLPFALVLAGKRAEGVAQFDRWINALDPEQRENRREFLEFSRGQLHLIGGIASGEWTSEGLRMLVNNRAADGLRSESDLVGLAYLALGQPDSAIAEWERTLRRPALSGHYHDANQLPTILPNLGRLYAERGDTARAIATLEEFIELWRDADPELQPRVTEARALLSQLRPSTDQRRGVPVPARTP